MRRRSLASRLFRARSSVLADAATATAYAALGLVLGVTRLADLGHSFWTDEIMNVSWYIDRGPRYIVTGAGVSHELFSLLAWATGTVTGDSEIAYRLWSAIPFILGVAIVTAWLHVRASPLSGILFLYLATVSPLLLDITRQARGYGLAFFGVSMMTVAALEVIRSRDLRWIAVFCAAGVLGTLTLPQVGVLFVASGATLLAIQGVRTRVAVGLAVPLSAIAAFFWPHVREVHAVTQIKDGVQLHLPWVVTAGLDQVLLPSLIWIDGTVLVAGVVWIPLIVLAVALMAASPFASDRQSLALLVSGVVVMVLVLWIGRAYVIPRYLSFLLVPLFILLATGMGAILERLPSHPAPFRTVASLVVIGSLGLHFIAVAPAVVRLPREAPRDAAEVVMTNTTLETPVLAYLRNPGNLAYYLARPFRTLRPSEVGPKVCGARRTVAFVMQSFAIPQVDVPCLTRAGVTHYRFRQYTRGETDVWLVPPAR